MNDSEREEFDRIAAQPDLADLRKEVPTSPAVFWIIISMALVVFIGGVLALVWMTWKVAVLALLAVVSLFLIGAAVQMRSIAKK